MRHTGHVKITKLYTGIAIKTILTINNDYYIVGRQQTERWGRWGGIAFQTRQSVRQTLTFICDCLKHYLRRNNAIQLLGTGIHDITAAFHSTYDQRRFEKCKVWYIYYKFSTECAGENNFENRSIFGKDMGKNLWLTFLAHPVDLFSCISDCLWQCLRAEKNHIVYRLSCKTLFSYFTRADNTMKWR